MIGMKFDKRLGRNVSIIQEPDEDNRRLLRFIMRKQDERIKAEQLAERSRKCPKCGNIRAMNGICDFCD